MAGRALEKKPKVLYIEDNRENRMLVRAVLEAAGYTIVEAEDGLAGIEAAIREEPALILLDINLPGVDGYEIVAILKSFPNLASTPVIAVTAYAMQGDRQRTLVAGCDGYIQKPINVDMFPRQVALHRVGGDGDHRGGREVGEGFEDGDDLVAVDARQVDIEEDERRFLTDRRLDAGEAVLGLDDGVPGRLQDGADQHPVLPVVLDVEDLRLLFECASRHTLSRPLSAQRQRELERGSLVLAALRPAATAVELDELLADRKPEPGPAGAPRDRIVQLLERLEQARQVLRADADPRVRHPHAHGFRLGLHADEHPALRREFDRVRQQIEEDLLHLGAVRDEPRQLERYILLELELLAARERHRRLDALVDQLVEIELLGHHLQLPRLDAREIEDPVDELEQVGPAVVHRADVGLLALAQVAVEAVQQHLREADDRVQRRPELVRHAREELRLQPARLHELGVRGRQLLVEPRVLERDRHLVREHGG